MLNFGILGGGGAATVVIPPTNLQGSATFPPAEVILTWDAPIGSDNPIASYEVWRDDVQLGGTALLTYTDDDGALLPDTSYKYQVLAVDDKGKKSLLSTHINVAIPNLILLDAPANMTIEQLLTSNDTVTIGWDAVIQGGASFDVASYNIYRGNVLIDTALAVDVSYADTPPIVSTTYTYSVAAVDTAGNEGAINSIDIDIYVPFTMSIAMTIGVGGAGALGYIEGNFGTLVPSQIDGINIKFLRTFTGLNSHLVMENEAQVRGLNTLYTQYIGLNEVVQLTWDGSSDYTNPSSQALFDFLTANKDGTVNLTISELDPS